MLLAFLGIQVCYLGGQAWNAHSSGWCTTGKGSTGKSGGSTPLRSDEVAQLTQNSGAARVGPSQQCCLLQPWPPHQRFYAVGNSTAVLCIAQGQTGSHVLPAL